MVLLLALLGPLVLLGLGLFVEADERGYGTHERFGMRPCMPMELWDVPCPGCGVTTSVTLAAQGELLQSLRTQPLGLLLALLAVGAAAWAPVVHLVGRDLWVELQRFALGRVGIGLGLATLLAWAYKLWRVRAG